MPRSSGRGRRSSSSEDGGSPDCGSGSPVFGSGSPDWGNRSPVFGSGSPDWGNRSPVFGSGSPDWGNRSPVFGSGSLDWGNRSPVFGSGSPDWGNRSPVFGSGSPDCGNGSPVFGSGSPDWGNRSPVFGSGSPDGGNRSPVFGSGSPDWGNCCPVFGSGSPDCGSLFLRKRLTMDKDTRNAIERATREARKLLEADFGKQLAGTYDVLPSGVVAQAGGVHLSPQQEHLREKIVAAVGHKRESVGTDAEAVADYQRDAAFTALNRFVALKMLEARGLVQECVSKGEQSSGYREFCGLAPGVTLLPGGAGYRLYLECVFDELSTEVKVLFDRRDAASVLWPGPAAFEALLGLINGAELAGVWGEDETIGWVYQFFNTGDERRKMREESQAPQNSRELSVRNQFFTPRYVVEFLTDNTLGRTWWQMRGGETALAERCAYLVKDGEVGAPRAKKDPRDIRRCSIRRVGRGTFCCMRSTSCWSSTRRRSSTPHRRARRTGRRWASRIQTWQRCGGRRRR